MKPKCTFITIEGGEGSGKTTLIEKLKISLPVIIPEKTFYFIKDPAMNGICGEIRKILLSSSNTNIAITTELLLYLAARAQLVNEKIFDHFHNKNAVIISDRFDISTYTYQTRNPLITYDLIKQYHDLMTQSMGYVTPTLTLFVDVDPKVGIQRSRKRLTSENIDEGRFEDMDYSIHDGIRDRCIHTINTTNDRVWKTIDTTDMCPAAVHASVLQQLTSFILYGE